MVVVDTPATSEAFSTKASEDGGSKLRNSLRGDSTNKRITISVME